jgi:hypothetical protein
MLEQSVSNEILFNLKEMSIYKKRSFVSGILNVFSLRKDGSFRRESESGDQVFTTLNRDE